MHIHQLSQVASHTHLGPQQEGPEHGSCNKYMPTPVSRWKSPLSLQEGEWQGGGCELPEQFLQPTSRCLPISRPPSGKESACSPQTGWTLLVVKFLSSSFHMEISWDKMFIITLASCFPKPKFQERSNQAEDYEEQAWSSEKADKSCNWPRVLLSK